MTEVIKETAGYILRDKYRKNLLYVKLADGQEFHISSIQLIRILKGEDIYCTIFRFKPTIEKK